jgi:hypothetical protein
MKEEEVTAVGEWEWNGNGMGGRAPPKQRHEELEGTLQLKDDGKRTKTTQKNGAE